MIMFKNYFDAKRLVYIVYYLKINGVLTRLEILLVSSLRAFTLLFRVS